MPLEFEVERQLLDTLIELLAGAEVLQDMNLIRRLDQVRSSIHDGKIRIAVVGEFGNGKSTLINSLVGAPLLPMGLSPATRALNRVTWGSAAVAHAVYGDGERLAMPTGALSALDEAQVGRLNHIDVETDIPWAQSAVFIDASTAPTGATPNGSGAQDALEEADCVLFVLNSDRLLSLSERRYISEKLNPAPVEQTVFVLNRIDGKTPTEIAAIVERAEHILGSSGFTSPLVPYSALHVLQAKIRNEPQRLAASDPAGLQDLVSHQWPRNRAVIRMASAARKICALSDELASRIDGLTAGSGERLRELDLQLQKAERIRTELEDEMDAACQRVHTGLESIRELLSIGLKGYALNLRERIPAELMRVSVDDARRFLPFYIQDALMKAVAENEEPTREAVLGLLSGLAGPAAAAASETLKQFKLEIEPPAIPLYVTRDRASLSQGSTFVRIAAGAVMFSEFYIGLLMLVTSILASEIGKQLEAGDRRVNMATSAQSLIHGSIDTMERSLDQQFGELRDAVLTNIRESFAPSLAENAVLRDQVQEMRMESEQGSEAALKQTERVRQHLDAARELIAGLESAPPAPGPVSIQAAVSQQPRSNNVEMNV